MRILKKSICFTESFTKHITTYNKFLSAVAWAGNPDFDMGKLLIKNEDKIQEMVVGLHFYQTSPEFIRRFLHNTNIKYIMQSDGTFHPKVYLFYNTCYDWTAIVGSGNFTDAAFHHNQEMSVEISSSDFEKESARIQFKDIRSTIDEFYAIAKGFNERELEDYEMSYKDKSNKFVGLKSFTKGITFLEGMDWDEYLEKVENSEPNELEMRLELLEEANKIFTNLETLGKSFYDLEEDKKRNLAGFPKDKEFEDSGINWHWFGSMEGAGFYKNEILKGRTIADAIDKIPLRGDVTKSMFDEYCQAFYDLDKENPLATTTRLLAMKRPDLFLCVNKGNKDFLCGELNITERSLTLDKYWNSVHIRILNSCWFKDSHPIIDKKESQIKRFQVAMLDCIYYDLANE